MEKKLLTILEEYFESGKVVNLEFLEPDLAITYNAVTVDYLLKYLLRNKYTEEEVYETLFDMYKNRKIGFLFCSNIKKMVWSSYYNCFKPGIYIILHDEFYDVIDEEYLLRSDCEEDEDGYDMTLHYMQEYYKHNVAPVDL